MANNRSLTSFEIRFICNRLMEEVGRANEYNSRPEVIARHAAEAEARKVEEAARKVREEKARAIRREVSAPRRRVWA